MKAQFINAKEQKLEIRELKTSRLKSLQEMVEGYIEVGQVFPMSGTYEQALLINEEGLLNKGITYGFAIPADENGGEYFFIGNGVLSATDPNTGETVSLKLPYGEDQVRWLSEEEVKKMRSDFDNGPAFRILTWK